MAGHNFFLYYFVFLAISLTCVGGSNGYSDDKNVIDLGTTNPYYRWADDTELDSNDLNQLESIEFKTVPVHENDVNNESSTRDSIEDAARSQKKTPHVTNNIRIDKVVISSPWSHLYKFPSQPEPFKSKNRNEFEELIDNWRNLLVSEELDEGDTAKAKYVYKLSEEAESLYLSLVKSQPREYLWPIEQGDTLSADLTTQFGKLLKLTLSYGTKGTIHYKEPNIFSIVEDGLDFMMRSGRYDGIQFHGNWWDWQVGVPTRFIDIMMILSEQLPEEKIQKYTSAISNYVPNPYSIWYTTNQGSYIHIADSDYHNASGSQQAEFAKILLGLGILQKNETKISLSLDSTKELLKIVSKGNGFYPDGSFIHHRDVPYTGLFGSVFVRQLGEILEITKGSKFEVARDTVETFFDNLERAFIPLIYQGEMIAPVKGLAISRSPLTRQIGSGSETLYNLLTAAKFASAKSEKNLKEAVKYWIQQNPDHYLAKATNYKNLQMAIRLLNDSAIAGDKLPFVGAKMYASMDRFVQQTPNYMLGLSLYSNRISAFEAGNRENKHGWHTADGAIYLYNYDEVQFGSDYWPTVDPYRLPGTTVDTVSLNDEVADYCDFTSGEKWVGGVAKSNQAVVGMALNKTGFKNNWRTLSMNLKAKKSWFVVDGQIIALGAEITGTTTENIETIVENRLLNKLYNYNIKYNLGKITAAAVVDVKWLLLETEQQNKSIGYYFPNGETVNITIETRTGTYREINDADPSDNTLYGKYSMLKIDHGQSPVNAKYAYVILPGISQSEIKEYSERNVVNILENSAEIQAVQILEQDYLGFNIWSETGGSVAGISSNKPVSLMRQIDSNQQTYVLSDPTQSDNVITIKIPDFSRVGAMSEGVYYDVKENVFVVDFKNVGGASEEFTVYNDPHYPLEAQVPEKSKEVEINTLSSFSYYDDDTFDPEVAY